MRLGDNIRFTLISTFDLYKASAKRFYGLSLIFSIFSSLFAIFSSGLVCILMLKLSGDGNYESGNLISDLFSSSLAMMRLQDITKAIVVLNIGIYGIFLLREKEKGFDDKYEFRDLIKRIPKDIWNQYLMALGVILVINALFFKNIFGSNIDEDHFFEVFINYDPADAKLKFYNWLNSIIELIKTYLPYLLAMLMVLYHYNGRVSLKGIKKYKLAFISALILSFVINTLSSVVVDYVNYYIIELIKIPFINEQIPILFGYLIGILIIAFFYLGFAAFIAFPFKAENESIDLSNTE